MCFVHFDLEMCFAPQRRAIVHLSSGQAYFSTLWSHKSLEKHSVSRLSYLFAHLHLLSSDSFSSLIFSLLLFSSLFILLLHLCFSSVHIVGSLTSKLPSIMEKKNVPNHQPVINGIIMASIGFHYHAIIHDYSILIKKTWKMRCHRIVCSAVTPKRMRTSHILS